ncbi:extracellular solute-binding protein [Gleimia hominis]|uniref:Extracellular solute-binding protein n=1 Tax=Gleimia hominis TaxID=595468 RepID=A0ABU3ICT3_9ACTO|nr:extracellular solute-binding protein [Gleimia hominis]MDT3767287.1 extracellular solute-binding protein [Gleimia hominis]
MQLTRRSLLKSGVLGLGLFGLVGLNGCSTEASSGSKKGGDGETKKMTLWTWPEGFGEKLLEEVKTNLKQYDLSQNVIGGDFKQKLTTAFTAASGLPDVTGVKGQDLPFFLTQDKYFEDLNELGAKDIKDQYLEWKWDEATTHDGKQIGIPIDIGPTVLFYRNDVMEEAGLPSEPDELAKAIHEWDAFIELGKELKSKRENTFLIRNCSGMFGTIRAQSGKDFIDEDDNYIGDQEHVRHAWDESLKALDAGIVAKLQADTADTAAAVNDGRLPADFGASWHLADLQVDAPETKGKWRVCKHPGSPTNNGGSFLTIPKGVDDPKASFELIKFILNPKNQAYEYQDKGNFPSTPASYEMEEVSGPVEFLGGQKAAEVFGDAAKEVKPVFKHAHSDTVSAPFTAELENVESSGKDRDQAWKDAVTASKRMAEQVGLKVR